jgi:predicted adenylyl cyclase CyaB
MPTPRRNIELKARLADLPETEHLVRALDGVRDAGLLRQCDTYFRVTSGRLKLRETDGRPAELIQYHRPDHPAERPSDDELLPVPGGDPAPLKRMLTSALGLRGEVRKVRHLYLWRNVRIHLDDVANLGPFLEFEAVLSPGDDDEPTSYARLAFLKDKLAIPDAARVSQSYSDLLGL